MGQSDTKINMLDNAAPSMIHENDYIVIDCVLCGARMKSVTEVTFLEGML